MRDGIPKTIPVPRKWQKFVESADRAADRGTQKVVDQLIEAVRYTFAKYFSREDRQSLTVLLDESQTTLPGIPLPIPTDLRPSPLADLLAKVLPGIGEQETFRTAITAELAAMIEADIAAHNRQIFEDLAGKCRPHELARVRTEMYRATALFDSRAEAERMLQSNPPQKPNKISADEDIR